VFSRSKTVKRYVLGLYNNAFQLPRLCSVELLDHLWEMNLEGRGRKGSWNILGYTLREELRKTMKILNYDNWFSDLLFEPQTSQIRNRYAYLYSGALGEEWPCSMSQN